ncbi:NUDIX domain-containing protein [Nocardia sp. NPDC001965]
MIGRHLADWFRKQVAQKLAGHSFPGAAGAAARPIRQTGETVKGHVGEGVTDRDMEARDRVEQSGIGTGTGPRHTGATGKAYTPAGRREWFERQFAEGNLDPDNLAAAKVIVLDEHGRVLMLQSPYEGKRTVPGGFVDNGWRKREQPKQAAEREVREELGEPFANFVRIERLLATNRKSPSPDHGRDHPITDHIYLATFDESTRTRVSSLPFDIDPNEVTAFDFLPPEDAVRSAGRKGIDVSVALEAHLSGKRIELVDGEPPQADRLE